MNHSRKERATGAWIALRGEMEGYRGAQGEPLGAPGITLARILFGLGSAVTLLMALAAVRRLKARA